MATGQALKFYKVTSLPTAATSLKGNIYFNDTDKTINICNGSSYSVYKGTDTDTNTWRGIVNNLTSTSTSDSLSAYQGKVLNDSKLNLSGGTMTGDLNCIKVTTSSTADIAPSSNAVASSPFARDFWHDHFAFLNCHSIYSNQITTDGSTWTDDSTDLTNLFIQKDASAVALLTADRLGRRFTIYSGNFHACQIAWFEWGTTWNSVLSNFSLKVEVSQDNSTWTTIAEDSSVSNDTGTHYIACEGAWSNKSYCRFAFIKTTNTTTGVVYLNGLKAWTSRKGNQGLGIEYEKPYRWTKTDIYPYTTGQNLGLSSNAWNAVYSSSFVVPSGTSSQFLKANGSVDSTTYVDKTTFDTTVGNLETLLASI